MAFPGGFDGSWKIREGRMIDFEGNRLEAVRWIAERHFASVAEKAKAGHIGNGVDWFRRLRLLVELLERGSGCGVQSAHRGDDRRERFRGGAIFFQRRSDNARPERLGKEEHIAGLGADVAPDAVRVDEACDRI